MLLIYPWSTQGSQLQAFLSNHEGPFFFFLEKKAELLGGFFRSKGSKKNIKYYETGSKIVRVDNTVSSLFLWVSWRLPLPLLYWFCMARRHWIAVKKANNIWNVQLDQTCLETVIFTQSLFYLNNNPLNPPACPPPPQITWCGFF